MEQAMVKDLVFDVMNLFFFSWLYPVSLMLLHIIDYYYPLCPVLCIEAWPCETGKYYAAWRVAVVINATYNFLSRQSSTFMY